ncbi:MAG: N-6 DNA methylase [Gammaproteobacteria bacterium]|nr:N-6 DNA methylase [Gammaproteobacteria bacterium]
MPLSWNEIRSRALAFSGEWKDASSESGDAQVFWNEFFKVFGVSLRRVASFEKRVVTGEGTGFIDLLWKGKLMVEHKSRGGNLDRARTQALNYFEGIKNESDLPRYVLVCDFARFRLHDLDENTRHDFTIGDLSKNVGLFAFIAGYQTRKLREQDPVNIKAAEAMGKLHDKMQANNYRGHHLEVYLVRLLFCLFADNTGIFSESGQFQFYIQDRTNEDGSDLGAHLHTLFEILNTPVEKRQHNRDEQLAAFPYVNGKLFEESLCTASFDSSMRKILLDCCDMDWGAISPAIFGSLFQSIMDKEARRDLGAHYTSEKNILKLINPLFMDDLRAEFKRARRNPNALFQFHKKLAALKFLDPACGCGNFLVIAYRELRLLELEILRATQKSGKQLLQVDTLLKLNVDSFYGMELEEFPAQIAQVAMWLVDHQMNLLASEEFGVYFARIPLETAATIIHGNALQMDWREVAPAEEIDYVMGNPPFAGQRHRSAEKTAEMLACYRNKKGAAIVDYVSAWYCKSLDFIAGTKIKVAFVSTNSLAQGAQVAPFWNEMRSRGDVHVHFAHRTFKWTNEARGKAAVHCIIIGFALYEAKQKRLFEYASVDAEPHEIAARNINPYLVDAPDAFVQSRGAPISSDAPPMLRGSDAVDDGHLLLEEDEKRDLLKREPQAKPWIRRYMSGKKFLNNEPRYCLWLVDCPPETLRKMPLVMERVKKCKETRLASSKAKTREAAKTPGLFAEIRDSKSRYLFIPKITSETRTYIPCAFLSPKVICAGPHFQIPKANLYHFGVFTSLMHMAWMRLVTGRLKYDYNYSAKVAYNNFPWPQNPTAKQTDAIKTAAQGVLDARAKYPNSTLADLYDPNTMPAALLKAHQKLDRAVDRAYRSAAFADEATRVAFLFDLYQKYTAPVLPGKKKRGR